MKYTPLLLALAVTACETAVGCADLGIPECNRDTACTTLRARPLGDDGEGNACFDASAPFEDLACVELELECGSAEEIAEDEAGQAWLFPSTCLPEGFTSVGSYAPDCPSA